MSPRRDWALRGLTDADDDACSHARSTVQQRGRHADRLVGRARPAARREELPAHHRSGRRTAASDDDRRRLGRRGLLVHHQPGEQKAHNLQAGNRHVIVTAANSNWDGMDVILEGEAVDVTDADRLGRRVDAYRTKYDDWFGFRLVDGRFVAPGAIGPVLVFDVRARKAFGFRKGDTF